MPAPVKWTPSSSAERLLTHSQTSVIDLQFSGSQAERTIRAGLLRDLLTGERGSLLRHLRLQNCLINDQLDLTGLAIECTFEFIDVVFERPPLLVDCSVVNMRFRGGELPGIEGRNLRARGEFVMESTCR